MKKPEIKSVTIAKNGTVVRVKNKRVCIIKQKNSKDKFAAKHLLVLQSMVSDTGEQDGVRCDKIKGKIKRTVVGLSDDALYAMGVAIVEYFNNKKHL